MTSAFPLMPKKNINAYRDINVAIMDGRFSSGIESDVELVIIP